MNPTKKAFIELAFAHNALQMGEFQLKSGRISPYFFNMGKFYHGKSLQQIGAYYAEIILKHLPDAQHLFGPAYKGLPLATATAIALALQNKNLTVTFNRKETKDHGEGGSLIGAPLAGSTVIIDDVITAGTAFREAQQLIATHGGALSAVIIALDRCERGLGRQSTLAEVQQQGISVFSIITLFDLIAYLQQHGEQAQVDRLRAYHSEYGA